MSLHRSALSAGVASTVSRASGLAREIALAAAFGASVSTDAYLAAFRVPNLFRDLFAEGSMANAFVPNFAREAEDNGLEAAWALANSVLGLLLVGTGLVVLGTIALAEPFVYVVAAGFGDVPGKVELTASLVRIVAPFLGFVSLASLFGGMLNVRGRFFLPAVAPAAFNLAVIAACLVPAAAWTSLGVRPIAAVALASTVGGAAMFAVQVPALRREGYRLRPTLRRHPALGRLLWFLGPALVGLATIQVGILVDVQIAATFGDGPVSWLSYAFRLAQLPMGIVGGAVAVAGLALLSTQVARGERDAARTTLTDAIGLADFLVLPGAIALFAFADPLVALAYERGAFGAADTAVTAAILRAYALGTLAFGLHRIVVPAFYAWGDPWTPMLLSIATVAAKIPLALWWTRPEWFGLDGIPLAHAAVATAEVALLVGLLARHAGGLDRSFFTDHVRILVAAGAMGAVAWGGRGAATSLAGSLALLAGSGATYLGVAAALGAPQVARTLQALRPPRGLPPHVDPATRAALEAHPGALLGAVEVGEGRVVVRTDRGTLVLAARDGVIAATTAEADLSPASSPADPLAIVGVLDTAGRPPPLRGLVLSAGSRRWAFVARGDRLEADEPVGASVEVG